MKVTKLIATLGFVAATATATSSIAAEMDIVDTAKSAGSFNTLVAAIQAAGLVDTLKGKGPYTVFAPTDAAFAEIPKAQLDALLADKKMLTMVLTYHVVPGKVMAADVKAGQVKSVEGQNLTITTANGGVMVDKADVVKTDIIASNGVIHVIDKVMIPN
ncbi:MAG: fasciclin domain-containing protein [Casimicrobiaceae bacterium]